MTDLSKIKTGNSVKIAGLNCTGNMRQRFIDLGMYKGTEVKVKSFAPLGDPMIIEVNECKIAIRKNDAKKLFVE